MEDDSLEVKEEEEATAEDEEVMDMGGCTCPYMYVYSVVCSCLLSTLYVCE